MDILFDIMLQQAISEIYRILIPQSKDSSLPFVKYPRSITWSQASILCIYSEK